MTKRLRQQLNLLFNAFSFFSRIPVPKSVTYSGQSLSQCVAYFPLVGWMVAAVNAAVIWLLLPILGPALAILLAMVVSCWTTGAFHEDGFADCCDGFGGGYQREQILQIMKDSRLGTYGVLGLCSMLALKFTGLLGLLNDLAITEFLLLLWWAHSLSRCSAVLLIWRMSYVRATNENSKAKAVAQSIGLKELALATVWLLPPALLLSTTLLWASLLACAVVTLLWARYLKLKLGGYTGDALGAQQQLSELFIYLSALAMLNTGGLAG